MTFLGGPSACNRPVDPACDGQVETLLVDMNADDGVTITSPYYPYYYPENSRCEWIIKPNLSSEYNNVSMTNGSHLVLSFDEPLDIEVDYANNCSYDSLEVQNKTFIAV
jgi:hypothetical protein